MFKRAILPICILLGFVVLCALGTWQVKRLAEKEALIARVERQLKAPPISFNQALDVAATGDDIEYRPVTVTGTFIPNTDRRYFISKDGKSGWYLYQALLVDGEKVVWVNRGFAPKENLAEAVAPNGQITFNGLTRGDLQQKPNYFTPINDVKNNIYYWKSIKEMSAPYLDGALKDKQIVPIFIDAGLKDKDQVWQTPYPKSGVTRVEFPNSHLQYAMTWYGLALACLGVGFAFWRTRQKNIR